MTTVLNNFKQKGTNITDLESLEKWLEKPPQRAEFLPKTRIFARSEVWLSSLPEQNWRYLQLPDHLNFVIGHLRNLYTKWEDDWTTWGWTTDNLPHPYQRIQLRTNLSQSWQKTWEKSLRNNPAASELIHICGQSWYKPVSWSSLW